MSLHSSLASSPLAESFPWRRPAGLSLIDRVRLLLVPLTATEPAVAAMPARTPGSGLERSIPATS